MAQCLTWLTCADLIKWMSAPPEKDLGFLLERSISFVFYSFYDKENPLTMIYLSCDFVFKKTRIITSRVEV